MAITRSLLVKRGLQGGQDSLAATSDEDLRQKIGLDRNSRVVIIATEGATDPEVYRRTLLVEARKAVLAESQTSTQRNRKITNGRLCSRRI